MVIFSKQVGIARAQSLLRHASLHQVSWQKKLRYGSALMLAFFVVPFAVQAISGTWTDGDSPGTSDTPPAAPQVQAAETDQPDPGPQSAESHTSTDVHAQSTINADGTTTTNMTVNGQNIPVPQNGSFQKQITTNDGQTTVNVQVDNGSGGGSSTSMQSHTNINVNSQSYNSEDQSGNRRGVDRSR